MKNILIPTLFEKDTLAAVKLAAELCPDNERSIVLMTVSELSDSISDLLFLSPRQNVDESKRESFYAELDQYLKESKLKLSVNEHHQFGTSGPVFRQLIEHFDVNFIIVPASFHKSKTYLNKSCLSLLNKSNCPLMLLPAEDAVPEGIQRALYINPRSTTLAGNLQKLPFHIIHQSMVEDLQLQPLEKVVNNFNIDLIVQTRDDKKMPENNELVFQLGLPVLTV